MLLVVDAKITMNGNGALGGHIDVKYILLKNSNINCKNISRKYKSQKKMILWWKLSLFGKRKKRRTSKYQFFSSYDSLDRPVCQIYFERVVRENIFPLLRNIHWREIEKILRNLVGPDQKKNSVMKFLSDPGPIIVYPSQWLTNSLTESRPCWRLNELT